MDIQSAALNELFALFPIIVPGWITPVRSVNTADGGIPKSLYDDQTKGLECLVDPWLERFNQVVAMDDRVELFINNVALPVDGKTIGLDEVNLRVRLYVPKGRLRDGVNQIYYRVTRAGGNGSEDSRKLSVLYHRSGPGEPAPDAIRLLIPNDVVADGIGPELAARGVDFGLEYDNRRPYDFISLTLGSRGLVERELTPEEGDSGQTPIQTLYTDTFTKNPDNPRTAVFFDVRDQLGNFNQSATHYIDVHVNRVLLTPPDLSENPDDPADDPSTIELGKLKDFLYVQVHVFSPLWVAGDIVRVSYTCTPPAPGTVVTHSVEATVGRLPFTHKLQVPVAKVLANSEVSVIYEQVRGGKVIGTSKPAQAQVIGQGVIKLNPPTLVAPAVTPIDLWLHLTGITLRTEFLAALTGDRAQLIEINPQPGATPFPAVAFNVNKRTNTVLSQAFLAARHGKKMEFRWALIRGGKEIARSGPLVLTVNRIVDGDARFPTPVIAGQTGPELDVTKLVAADQLSVAAWPLQVSGQYVWLRYDGINSSGAPVFFDDLNGVLHNEAQGLSRPAPVAWLAALQQGTKVTISFRVNLGKVADLSAAVTFPVRNYTVRSAIAINPPTTPTNPVDPLSFVNGVTVRVDAAVVQPGDQAQLILLNPLPGSVAFPVLPLDQKYAIFTLDAKFLGQWHGNVAQLAWVWIRGGKEIARSGPLMLNVKRIAEGDARFPTPVIAGQTGRELDVTKLVATDKLSIAAWPLQVPGQYVWLRYDGFNSSGAPVYFDDLNGVPHNDTHGLTRPALVEWLKVLKDRTSVTITFKVQFAEGAVPVTFPIRTYTVKALVEVRPVISKVAGSNGVDIPNGSTTVYTSVTLSGTATPNLEVEIFNGATSLGKVPVNGTGNWTKPVTGITPARYSFTAKALYGTGLESMPPRSFTIAATPTIVPQITAIYANGVLIPRGGILPQNVPITWEGTNDASGLPGILKLGSTTIPDGSTIGANNNGPGRWRFHVLALNWTPGRQVNYAIHDTRRAPPLSSSGYLVTIGPQ